MTGVAIVTDSTACLPPGLAAQWDVAVIGLRLSVGGHVGDETKISTDTVVRSLVNNVAVATAPPDPIAFDRVYRALAARGARAIVSIHLSSALSATCDSAHLAASHSSIPVYVIDSRTTGMSLGYAVLAAAMAAQAGGTPQRIVDAARRRYQRSYELFYVDTLEYLRRGGRVSALSAWFGTKLSIKPLLTLRDGEIRPLERVRGSERAMRRLTEEAAQCAGDSPVNLAVEYFDSPGQARVFAGQLAEHLPRVDDVVLTKVSTILGAHIGPGALGVTISPA